MKAIRKEPYSKDEERVAKFFTDLGIGGGDDPIGALLASHQVLANQRNQLRVALGTIKERLNSAVTEFKAELDPYVGREMRDRGAGEEMISEYTSRNEGRNEVVAKIEAVLREISTIEVAISNA